MKKGSGLQTVFILVQTILYVGFLTLDLADGSIILSEILKYAIIILCFCYALSGAGKGTFYLLQAALFFTLVSDLFILILDYYFYGVLTFIIVQELYSLRLILLRSVGLKMRPRIAFLKRLLLQIASAFTVILALRLGGVAPDPLLIASVFYFICIFMNAITAIALACKAPGVKSNLLYAIGMLLFLLCDINVGLFNLSGFISLPENIYHTLYAISSILMWTFYAPAQVLIALSSGHERSTPVDKSDRK